jgi:hypothetical protein
MSCLIIRVDFLARILRFVGRTLVLAWPNIGAVSVIKQRQQRSGREREHRAQQQHHTHSVARS